MPHSPEFVSQLNEKLSEIPRKALDIQTRLYGRTYRHDRGREFAFHGFGRRLSILERCIYNVFAAIPASQTDQPTRQARLDADINIQAFVFNVFGALDNLAWMWAFERLAEGENLQIPRREVNLNRPDSPIRSSFSRDFQDFLNRLTEWFRFQEDYRHALAHRIPLYIPPSAVPTDDVGAHRSLGEAMYTARARGDIAETKRLRRAQSHLAVFQPVMIHSFGEQSRPVVFHPQLLADFECVGDIATRVLNELDDTDPVA